LAPRASGGTGRDPRPRGRGGPRGRVRDVGGRGRAPWPKEVAGRRSPGAGRCGEVRHGTRSAGAREGGLGAARGALATLPRRSRQRRARARGLPAEARRPPRQGPGRAPVQAGGLRDSRLMREACKPRQAPGSSRHRFWQACRSRPPNTFAQREATRQKQAPDVAAAPVLGEGQGGVSR